MTTGRGIAIAGLSIAASIMLIHDVSPIGYLPLMVAVYATFMVDK
jgi:hypothetical protein